jgi:hypothetical protein
VISIEKSLERAVLAAAGWSSRAAREAAAALTSSSAATVDWDEGAGECWVRLIIGPRVVALFSVTLPFVLIQQNIGELKELGRDMIVVAIDDFDKIQLSCSRETLNEAFGSSDRFGLLDPQGFSANDLWYATV